MRLAALLLVAGGALAVVAPQATAPMGCPDGSPGGMSLTFMWDSITAGTSPTHQYAKTDFIFWTPIDGSVDFYVGGDTDYTVPPPAPPIPNWVELGGSTGRAAMLVTAPIFLPAGSYSAAFRFAGSHALPGGADNIAIHVIESPDPVTARPTSDPTAVVVRDPLEGYSAATLELHFATDTTFTLGVGLADPDATDGSSALFSDVAIGCRYAVPPTIDFAWASCGFDAEFWPTSSDLVDSWLWEFGDGASNVGATQRYTYYANGDYDVTLTVRAGPYEVSVNHTVPIRAGCPEADGHPTHPQADPPRGSAPRDGTDASLAEGDADGDGIRDADDNCPNDADPEALDLDADGAGDVCDPDLDGDEVGNDADVCPRVADPLQRDADADGLGDACDEAISTECGVACTVAPPSEERRARSTEVRRAPAVVEVASPPAEVAREGMAGAFLLLALGGFVILRARR